MVFDLSCINAYCVVLSKSLLQNTRDCRSQKPFTLPYRSICYIGEKAV